MNANSEPSVDAVLVREKVHHHTDTYLELKKGYSRDRKFMLFEAGAPKYLLRISEKAELDVVKSSFAI